MTFPCHKKEKNVKTKKFRTNDLYRTDLNFMIILTQTNYYNIQKKKEKTRLTHVLMMLTFEPLNDA